MSEMNNSQVGLADSCVVRLQRRSPIGQSFLQGVDASKQSHPEFSCSGVVINPQTGLVLTSGQVFVEAVKRRPRGVHSLPTSRKWKISAGRPRETFAYFTANDLMKDVTIDVILPESSQEHPELLPASPSKSFHQHVPEYGNNYRTRVRKANLVILWKCWDFDNILKTIIPERDGWKFWESTEGDDRKGHSERDLPLGQCVEPFGLSSVSRNLPMENFISWFALLRLKESDGDSTQVSHPLKVLRPSAVLDGLSLQQGDPVCLHTTPFGATCPSVFLNSASMGIVSNVAGRKNQLIMTDARCIPGSEGGGMYTVPAKDKLHESKLAGIIVTPLCWKNNEWIGLTMVCSIQAVVESLLHITDSWVGKQVPPSLPFSSESGQESRSSVIQQCMRFVVVIKVGAVWGSGVIVNADKGIILTCRHVVHKATDRHVRVRLDYPYMHWEDATVIYATGPSSPFDLAVLKLVGGFGALTEAFGSTGIRTAKLYTQGQPVVVVGHALLAPELDLLPSVNTGVVSKVISANNAPIMLQSTCAVHAGASGGALFCCTTGQLLGIVTSNARDVDSGASFPHVNFSIPWTFIEPILDEYLQTENVKMLGYLDGDDKYVDAVWSLDEKRIYEKQKGRLLSKL